MSAAKKWSELSQPFARFIAQKGVPVAVEGIPAARSTVYRLLRGQTTEPSQAIRAGVERLVDDQEKTE